MKKTIGVLAFLLTVLSGTLIWIFMLLAFVQWWGGIGVIASFIFTPGIVIFPFIYWFVEHQFPINYFIYWGIGVVGIVMRRFS